MSDILKGKRAQYGAQIVAPLGRQSESEFGRGFGRRNLFRVIRFAEVFPDSEIVRSLIARLGWTHFLYLIGTDHLLQGVFCAQMYRTGSRNPYPK